MRPLHILCFLLIIARSMPCTAQENPVPPPVIAVLSASQSQSETEIADYLATSLATDSARCHLVERAELNRLVQEKGIQTLQTMEGSMALSRLAKADGLVFVSEIPATTGSAPDEGKGSRMAIRLVSCRNGIILKSLELPNTGKDLAAACTAVCEILLFSVDRLAQGKSVADGKVILLSLQGIHALTTRPADLGLETWLNVSLAREFAIRPNVQVLERWNLADLDMDRALSHGSPGTLETGSFLVEGSLVTKNEQTTVNLVLRSGESGDGQNMAITAPANQRKELLRKIADAVGERALSRPVESKWDVEAEARAYSALGKWYIGQDLYKQANQALETSLVLNPRDVEARNDLIESLCSCIIPLTLRIVAHFPKSEDAEIEKDLPFRLRCAIRMCENIQILHGCSPDSRTKKATFLLGMRAVALLEIIRRNGWHIRLKTEVADLRTLLREICEAGRQFTWPLDCAAGYWSDTPELAMEKYRKILLPDAPFWNMHVSATQELCGMHTWQPLVDWESPKNDRAQKLWHEFVTDLKRQQDPFHRAIGLVLSYESCNKQEKAACLSACFDLLLEISPSFGNPEFSRIADCMDSLPPWNYWNHPEYPTKGCKIAVAWYTHRPLVKPLRVSILTRVLDNLTPIDRTFSYPHMPELERELYDALIGYLKRIEELSDETVMTLGITSRTSIESSLRNLRARNPEWEKQSNASRDELPIRVIPLTQVFPNIPDKRARRLACSVIDSFDETGKSKEFVIGYIDKGFRRYDFATGKSRDYVLHKDWHPFSKALSKDRTKVAVWSRNELYICNLASGEWLDTQHNLMDNGMNAQVVFDDQALWVGAWAERNPAKWSIGKYEKGTWTWVAHGSRRPAENPLDALNHTGIKEILKSAEGVMQVIFDIGHYQLSPKGYYQRFEIESGKPLEVLPMIDYTFDFEGGILEFDARGKTRCITATLKKPGQPDEILLDAVDYYPGRERKAQAARWECPSDLFGPNFLNGHVYWSCHDDRLYAFLNMEGNEGGWHIFQATYRAGLYVFEKNRKHPRWIPVSLAPITKSGIKFPSMGSEEHYDTCGWRSTSKRGILLANVDDSLLCIPWGDIDRWLESHPAP